MTTDLVRTTYGPPALDALARVVGEAKHAEPLAPVTVVVPSNHVGVTARRALGRRGRGVIGVTFLTPFRLAELLGAPALAAAGRRPVSTPVVAAALRRALRENAGVFGPVAEHAATEEALVGAIGELADLSRGALDRLGATSPRAGDVVRLHRRTRDVLAAKWYDEADLVRSARAALSGGGGGVAGLGHLVVYLPQDLTRRAAALLREAAAVAPTTVIAASTGQPKADAGVARSLARLGLESGPGDGDIAGVWPVAPETTRAITTSDADDEVRAAVRAVVDAMRSGTPLERIAILFATPQPYARLVHEHLAAAGIPANGIAPHSLAGHALGRALLDLLALRRHGYRRGDVLSLLTSAPLQPRNGRQAPTAEWERLSREAVVVAGRMHWDIRLERLAADIDRRVTSLDPIEPPDDADDADDAEPAESGWARWLGRKAEWARDLRALVLDTIDELDAAAAATAPWRERVRWLRRLSRRLVGSEVSRESWPLTERKAAERVEAALDRLVGLDLIDEPNDLDVFQRTLELELDADLGRVGRFGEGILVAPLSFAVGLDLDLVVVLGMAEGTLPARVADDSLLPDRERRATDGELPLRREQIDRQRRQLHAALAGARTHVLCAPRGDLRASNERMPSRWLGEILDLLQPRDGTEPAVEFEHPHVDHVHSFAHGVTHVAFPATEQEYRLAAPAWAEHDAVVAAGKELQQARRSTRFTRYDGNLNGLPVRSPLDDVVSATRLESWASCPHAYFMRQVLRVNPVEDPADTLWISPLDKGSLIHEVLEHFVLAVLDLPANEQPAPTDPWNEAHHALLREIAGAVCDSYEGQGIVGRELFWQRDRARILLRLDRLLYEDDTYRRRTSSRPIAAEMAFGLPGDEKGPVGVPIAGDRTLQFRGSADRVDRADDSTLRVIDYKTGGSYDYRGLSPDNPDDRGTHLQLAVYGIAARARHGSPETPVVAEYWFVNDREAFTTIGYAVSDAVLDHVGTTLATIVDGIEHGQFVARPTATSSDPWVRCRYCDPDGLGVTDRRREWDRKRRDPLLAAYAALAEPSEA